MMDLMKALAPGHVGRLEDAMMVWDLIRPERDSLVKLKRISLRNKSWFRVLSWEQRRFIDATIMVVERIRSILVLRLLAPLVMKLLSAVGKSDTPKALALMGESAFKVMRDVAQRLSRIAQSWGNKLAHKWVEDASFIKFLTVMSLSQNINSNDQGEV